MGRFAGFPTAGLRFLDDLARQQNRDWFAVNRAIYEDTLQAPMSGLILDLTDEFFKRGVPLQGDPKHNVFRINRDVRFSKDKSPYKTHIGATLTVDGAKLSFGVLYIHVDPRGAFAAAGFYMPESDNLEAMRRAVADNPVHWKEVENRLANAGLALTSDESALKRVPRGFEEVTDTRVQEILKRKSWIVQRTLTGAELASPGLVGIIADFAEGAMPLLRFGLEVTGRA